MEESRLDQPEKRLGIYAVRRVLAAAFPWSSSGISPFLLPLYLLKNSGFLRLRLSGVVWSSLLCLHRLRYRNGLLSSL